MTECYPTDREFLERDCDAQFFIASGPGGQHRNKVESGVRLIHRPTGMTVTATERRSQHDPLTVPLVLVNKPYSEKSSATRKA